jgi:hypothetical protein
MKEGCYGFLANELFASVFADAGGDLLEHDGGGVTVERDCDGAVMGVAVFADGQFMVADPA